MISSLKTESDIRRTTLLPTVWAFENYRQVWEQVPLLRYFGNSLGLSLVSMALAVVVATMAGYAFSRFRFFGRNAFGGSVLTTQLFPGVLLLVPFFLIFSTLQNTPLLEGLNVRFIGRNVYWGNLGLMLLAYTSAVLPFTIWVMRGYIDSLPADLEEAAEIDGSSRFGAFFTRDRAAGGTGHRHDCDFGLYPRLERGAVFLSVDQRADAHGGPRYPRLSHRVHGALEPDDGRGRHRLAAGRVVFYLFAALARLGFDGGRGQGLGSAHRRGGLEGAFLVINPRIKARSKTCLFAEGVRLLVPNSRARPSPLGRPVAIPRPSCQL